MAKSIAFAYALWFLMGIFGVHQFYLRRDRHSFCLWATLGGFGLGWIRDIWKIPEYVADANESPEYIATLTEKMKKRNKPKVSWARWIGQLCMGSLLGHLVYFAVPLELYEKQGLAHNVVVYIVANIAVALGTHLVGNVGRHDLTYISCLVGSFGAAMVTYNKPTHLIFAGFTATLASNKWGLSWRRTPPAGSGLCSRLIVLVFCAAIYQGMWLSAFYYNASITTAEGETVKVRDAVHNFFNSKAWREMSDVVRQMYAYVQQNGWWSLWSQLVYAIDPQGEQHAYQVLGLEKGASQEAITSAYRRLARQWHPDKAKDEDKRKEAEEKFVEIQQAYDTISSLKARRLQKNSNRPLEGAKDT